MRDHRALKIPASGRNGVRTAFGIELRAPAKQRAISV
jgi:hypothetical protein